MDFNLSPTLSNSKVILKPLKPEDETGLQLIANEKELWVYGLSDLSEPGNLKKYIDSAIADRRAGTTAVWTIIDPKTNTIAGCTRLAEIDFYHERGQIGWTWIGKQFQGTGINKAMKYEILKYGFESLNLNRIELKADERNINSCRAILSLGATQEGTLRQHIKAHNGYLRNTVYFSILKSEWPEVKARLEAMYRG